MEPKTEFGDSKEDMRMSAKENKPALGENGIYNAKELGTPRMLLLGLQHMFAMFGATILVPMLTGLDVSTTLLFAGLGTLLFHFLAKGKVPAFLGSSFAFLAGFDYMYQRWEYERKLKMTKQEIKEEYKNTEGDPQIKGRIKQKQRENAQRRMMQAVPEANVVIRNPTHYAVALKYEYGTDSAPIVVAKGKDNIAFKIIEIAEAHDIVIVENRPLARALYAEVDIDKEIPSNYYQAVAEVIAFVYKVKKKELKQNE